MTDIEWFAYYNEHKEKFKWFIQRYFTGKTDEGVDINFWEILEFHSKQGGKAQMLMIMNNIWFLLPDHKFNIIENPPGWSEFLYLIEE